MRLTSDSPISCSFSNELNSSVCLLFFFFFFQAEDGIRDSSVTGVQTCALPIYIGVAVGSLVLGGGDDARYFDSPISSGFLSAAPGHDARSRSSLGKGTSTSEDRKSVV